MDFYRQTEAMGNRIRAAVAAADDVARHCSHKNKVAQVGETWNPPVIQCCRECFLAWHAVLRSKL